MWAQGLLDYDELVGLDWEWQAMDGAMTKAPLGKEKIGPNPTDRAKRGVKRSLLVEGHGIPIGLEVEGANRNDFKMLQATIPIARPMPIDTRKQNLCLDKGYDYNEVRDARKSIWLYPAYSGEKGRSTSPQTASWFQGKAMGSGAHTQLDEPFSWGVDPLGEKVENYLGLLHLACAWITYRAVGLLG
ncbi:hypothetical protein KSB_44110 [Ktedonobacter robiniae]|uniref:Transposase IS4-like domain-containing protein n=1 Tax=Ktedonobacter robiniae TaxID=2778365 RepID=A0ABQ3UTC4_9CHLR|nr:hypothetical protein KSB_44110 [Ktedonobacter robiniae]